MILRKIQQLEILNKAQELGIDPKIFEFILIPMKTTFFGIFNDATSPETQINVKATNYFFNFVSQTQYDYYKITLKFSPDREINSRRKYFEMKTKEYQWETVFNWYIY